MLSQHDTTKFLSSSNQIYCIFYVDEISWFRYFVASLRNFRVSNLTLFWSDVRNLIAIARNVWNPPVSTKTTDRKMHSSDVYTLPNSWG